MVTSLEAVDQAADLSAQCRAALGICLGKFGEHQGDLELTVQYDVHVYLHVPSFAFTDDRANAVRKHQYLHRTATVENGVRHRHLVVGHDHRGQRGTVIKGVLPDLTKHDGKADALQSKAIGKGACAHEAQGSRHMHGCQDRAPVERHISDLLETVGENDLFQSRTVGEALIVQAKELAGLKRNGGKPLTAGKRALADLPDGCGNDDLRQLITAEKRRIADVFQRLRKRDLSQGYTSAKHLSSDEADAVRQHDLLQLLTAREKVISQEADAMGNVDHRF